MLTYKQKYSFDEKFDFYKKYINKNIESFLKKYPLNPPRLIDAIRYSSLDGGKRLRAILVYASGELLSIDKKLLDPIAVAVELIHSFSLIHDDLPSMDDDDLRRGKPSLHRAFDEGTAILTGDILQTIAFDIVINSKEYLNFPNQRIQLLRELAHSIGLEGMTGGQYLDLNLENIDIKENDLIDIYTKKTGSLIRASIIMPSFFSELKKNDIEKLEIFSTNIGLAYQIKDDLLEVEHTTEMIGKNINSDKKNKKNTFPSVIGIEQSKNCLAKYNRIALDAISKFGEKGLFLKSLSQLIIEREK